MEDCQHLVSNLATTSRRNYELKQALTSQQFRCLETVVTISRLKKLQPRLDPSSTLSSSLTIAVVIPFRFRVVTFNVLKLPPSDAFKSLTSEMV